MKLLRRAIRFVSIWSENSKMYNALRVHDIDCKSTELIRMSGRLNDQGCQKVTYDSLFLEAIPVKVLD